jgi:hypothetical protein
MGSMDSKESTQSAAAQFRAHAALRAYEEPESVTLPDSGITVTLRRPKPLAFALATASLPASELKAVESEPGSEETMVNVRSWAQLFEAMFVVPRLSMDPKSDEIAPSFISDKDTEFLMTWALGLVGSGGADLDRFHHGGRSGAGDAGPDGGEVRGPAE